MEFNISGTVRHSKNPKTVLFVKFFEKILGAFKNTKNHILKIFIFLFFICIMQKSKLHGGGSISHDQGLVFLPNCLYMSQVYVVKWVKPNSDMAFYVTPLLRVAMTRCMKWICGKHIYQSDECTMFVWSNYITSAVEA